MRPRRVERLVQRHVLNRNPRFRLSGLAPFFTIPDSHVCLECPSLSITSYWEKGKPHIQILRQALILLALVHMEITYKNIYITILIIFCANTENRDYEFIVFHGD